MDYRAEFKKSAADSVLYLGAGYLISLLPETHFVLDTLRDGTSFCAYALGAAETAYTAICAYEAFGNNQPHNRPE